MVFVAGGNSSAFVTISEQRPEKSGFSAFIYKRLRLNLGKLTEEERTFLKKIAQKSDLLKNSNIQRAWVETEVVSDKPKLRR